MEPVLLKIIGIILFSLFSLCSSSFAKDFGSFSMDIPSGWLIERDDSLFRFLHPENNCIINVMVGNLQEAPSRELAIAFYQGLNGKNAKNIDDGFTFDVKNEDNIPGRVRFTSFAGIFSVASAIGQCHPFQKYLSSLVIYNNADQNDKQIVNEITRPYPIVPTPTSQKNKENSPKE